jgi:type II secretory pathway component PulF
MARRVTKAESSLILLLIAIGVPMFLIVEFFETFGFFVPIIVIIGIVIVVVVMRTAARKKRVSYLLAKYCDQQIVDRVMSKTIWAGETCDQLVESLGRPADLDEKI